MSDVQSLGFSNKTFPQMTPQRKAQGRVERPWPHGRGFRRPSIPKGCPQGMFLIPGSWRNWFKKDVQIAIESPLNAIF